MKIKINDTVVEMHANTYQKIMRIAKERKLTLSEAVSYCLKKVN